MNILPDDSRVISPDELKALHHATLMTWADVLPLLQSPDSKLALKLAERGDALTDGEHLYALEQGVPRLYPEGVAEVMQKDFRQFDDFGNAKLKYFLVSKIKQTGEITAVHSDVHAQRHFFRIREFVSDLKGSLLDVGCDDVSVSSGLYPPACDYVGLDPYTGTGGFRVVGVAEVLPFRDESFENVIFNTSLDHIPDYFEAVSEAFRVLKPNGSLVVATLIWNANASLLADHVHFHHFKDYEIQGALDCFAFKEVKRKAYNYKNAGYRYALYLHLRKMAA